jgi:hypothetical protein
LRRTENVAERRPDVLEEFVEFAAAVRNHIRGLGRGYRRGDRRRPGRIQIFTGVGPGVYKYFFTITTGLFLLNLPLGRDYKISF